MRQNISSETSLNYYWIHFQLHLTPEKSVSHSVLSSYKYHLAMPQQSALIDTGPDSLRSSQVCQKTFVETRTTFFTFSPFFKTSHKNQNERMFLARKRNFR